MLHSSAGAGKTHALVRHFLVLALSEEDPGAYTRILALTFTNKAAGELRERVVHYLEGLSKGGPLSGALQDVEATVRNEVGITAAEVRQRAADVLTHMLHHWSQLAVSTIDAFTRRVVMPFARDLRLDHDLRMTTEEEHYRAKAVDLLLEEAGTDHALTQLLVATCEQLLEEERSWRPDKPLLDLSKQLGRENALEHLAALRGIAHEHFIAVNQQLQQRVTAFREQMRTLGRQGLEAVAQAGLREQDLAYGKAGPSGFLRKLAEFDRWVDVNRNAEKALLNDKWAAGSAKGATLAAIEGIAPVLRTSIGGALDAREAMRTNAVAAAVLRDLMPTATLQALEQRLEQLKSDEGVAFFSDLTRKVAAIVQEEPAPFLYERLGEKYHHFLIDEFQDTSLLQWHALLPLLENALSTGGSALLVGDAKQAIYRWRNGEVRQFILLPELYGKEKLTYGEEREQALLRAYASIEPLAANHRSAHGVITTNNLLFAALREDLPEDLRAVYHRHEQEHRRSDEGYVEITCFDAEEQDEDAPRAELAWCERVVREALADGFRAGDIAVLTRSNQQGRSVAGHLIAQGHTVSSPDGLALGTDPGVQAVIALLAWTHRQDDQRAAIAAQRMAALHAPNEEVDPFTEEATPQALLRTWSRAHPLIAARSPLLPLVSRIVRALALDPARDAFVMGLMQEVHAFVRTDGDDVPSFLEHWQRAASKRSVPGSAGSGTIQVMTIHKSKGLQFPVVLVPFTNMASRGSQKDPLWIAPGPLAEDLPSVLVRPSAPLDTLEIPEIDEELRLRALDELDLLYVAFTRPEQRLYAGVDGKSKDRLSNGLRTHFQIGPGQQATVGTRAPAIVKAVSEPAAIALAPTPASAVRDLAIRRDAPEEWDPADPDPFRTRGRAVHAILARVRTPEDLERAVQVEGDANAIPTTEREQVHNALKNLIARADIAPFFAPGLTVRTEVTLIDRDGHALRPDRVVQGTEGTRVLDIKTGSPADAHAAQVRGYAEL
ncbi:MAG TPA: UvrD-helicase domain-containing protein, partial [Flavobacteriales bacterium]|nr:UvrD-helicase domain-containing protein [Flavobacteriales bacterium]